MSKFRFTRATKHESYLRMALIGPTGSGKTFSALSIATGLGERIAVIDTERGSARKYSDRFSFDVLELESFAPTTYVEAITLAVIDGYDVVIVDSLSHAWIGKDGALEQVDRAAKRGGNSFAGWRDVTPQHNALVDALLGCRAHLIGTMRSKTEYVIEEDARGKKVPRKIGMAPIQRDGVEYEFDVVAELTIDHNLCVTKTRMSELDGLVERNPGRALGQQILQWTRVEKAPEPEYAGTAPVDANPKFSVAFPNTTWNGLAMSDAPHGVLEEYMEWCRSIEEDSKRKQKVREDAKASRLLAEAVFERLIERQSVDPIAKKLENDVEQMREGFDPNDANEAWGLTPDKGEQK